MNHYLSIVCPDIHDEATGVISYHKGWKTGTLPSGVQGTPPQVPTPVANVRNPDGSITVDSVASGIPLGSPPKPGDLIGGANLTANALNFTSPSYTWQAKGDGTLSITDNQQLADTPEAGMFSFNEIYHFGSSDQPKQETYTVYVTDSDGATGANTFTVNYHLPAENWQPSGMPYQLAPKLIASSDTAQVLNGGVVIVNEPSREMDFSVGAHWVGGVLTVGAAVVGVAAPETDPLLIGLAAGAGYTFGLATPPDPTPIPDRVTLQDFTNDIQKEIQTASTSSDGQPAWDANYLRIDIAKQIAQSGDIQGYYDGKYGQITFNVSLYELHWEQDWIGDQYGRTGYIGPISGEKIWTGSYDHVYRFNFSPSAPPPTSGNGTGTGTSS